jgi:mannose-1-phosphate guanylyltransferase
LLATVEDPSRFGVVINEQETGKVHRFVEKPKQFVGNHINAGIYVLNTSILDKIPERFCMIETEIYPKMAEKGELYSLPIRDNFWYDIGKPADYIKAQGAFLDYYKIHSLPEQKNGNIFVHESSTVGPDCKLGPNVAIGPNCKIGRGVRLANCSIIANTTVGDNTFIRDTIISWNCSIGSNVRIEGLTAIAEDCEVRDEVRITECMVCSHKNVSANVQKEILM